MPIEQPVLPAFGQMLTVIFRDRYDVYIGAKRKWHRSDVWGWVGDPQIYYVMRNVTGTPYNTSGLTCG